VIIADDLFAGAGGWDLAAADLGIHARGVENMKEARATREAAGLETIHDDVWTFEPDGKASGLIASPPCQTFSAAGKGSGRKALDDVRALAADVHRVKDLREAGKRFDDERTALVLTPLHFATQYPYEWLAWEQVPTVLPVWETCADILRPLGWNVWTGLLHAEQYGVPQTRKRAFLLASLDGPVEPPNPTHSRYHSRSPRRLDEDVLPWVSMAEALGWGATDQPAWTVMTARGRQTGHDVLRGSSWREGKIRELLDSDSWKPPAGRTINGAELPGWALGTTNVRDGEYQSRGIDAPAPTVTAAARSFRWGVPPLMVTTPVVKGGNMQENRVTIDRPEAVVYVNGTHANAARRPADRPAPTVMFGARSNGVTWEPVPAIEGDTVEDVTWVHDRPSPTIVGSYHPEVVAKPGYRKAGDPPRQKTPGSVRVTVEEAGVLQSFPADYPWQGKSGKQYLQCGNAVPPGLARAALSAVVPAAAQGRAA